MTHAEIQAEWKYRYAERLALLCPEGEPTRDQINLAAAEADAWEAEYKRQNQN